MKDYTSHNGQNVQGVSILESIIVNPRKFKRLVEALSALNLTIDPAVQVTDKKRAWVK
jgi:hypothetical protein